MMLKPKPNDQKTDEELERDLKKVEQRDSFLWRNNKHVNMVIAMGLFAGGYYTAKAMITTGLAMTGPAALPLVLGGMVAGPAIWAVGAVGCAIGWTNIFNRITGSFQRQVENIRKEQDDRAFKKTPAYQEVLRRAKEEAIAAKEALKKAFNNAVDKVFHGGTENKVQVSKPLAFKKPGEEPKKKRSFFGPKN